MTRPSARPRPAPLPGAAQAAKALGHPTRLRLLALLRHGPLCVCQMTAALEQATSTVSGHLLDLKRAGLVTEEKRGKWVEYRLTDDSPFRALVQASLDLLRGDPQADRDARIVRGLKKVPLDVLCRAGLDLRVVGVSTPIRTGRES